MVEASKKSNAVIETKLQTALKFKEEGNVFYKSKDFKKAMRKYHNAILYMKGIDNDLHGTPEFLKTSSVNPDSEKKIDDELEDKCIEANISIYNNLGKNPFTLESFFPEKMRSESQNFPRCVMFMLCGKIL